MGSDCWLDQIQISQQQRRQGRTSGLFHVFANYNLVCLLKSRSKSLLAPQPKCCNINETTDDRHLFFFLFTFLILLFGLCLFPCWIGCDSFQGRKRNKSYSMTTPSVRERSGYFAMVAMQSRTTTKWSSYSNHLHFFYIEISNYYIWIPINPPCSCHWSFRLFYMYRSYKNM